MTHFHRKLKIFKHFKRSRKIGVVFSLISIIIFQVSSLASLGASFGLTQILSDIKVPAGYVHLDLDIIEPDNLLMVMPYEIDNSGIYKLFDIKTSASISVTYLNKSNLVNITSIIFTKSSKLPDVEPFSTLSGFFEGNKQYFNEIAIIDMFNNSNTFDLKFYVMNLSFSAVYFFGLIRFSFRQDNIKL